MLVAQPPRRKPSSRHPFRAPCWRDDHPDLLRLDSCLPPEHHARWLRAVVSRLDLSTFRLSYRGYGSLAYPVELLLAFVLFMYSKGVLSPAQWATHARYDDQSKWLLRGLLPSRSQLYAFRDRCEPFLDEMHKQLLAWAIAEGVTAASRGSLDGSFVASLASRHQLMSCRRIDRRLMLLRLLAWLEAGPGEGALVERIGRLPELILAAAALSWMRLCSGVEVPEGPSGTLLLLLLLGLLLALLGLLSPQGRTPQIWPARLPAWVPATPAGRLRVLRRHEDAQQRLSKRLEPLRCKAKPSKKDQHTLKRAKASLTDPEAALGWDKVGTFRPLFNLALVQATDAPLTLAFDVLARNNDDGLLRPMMEKTTEQLGGRHLEEVLADGAFVCVPDVAWCEKQGITVYSPPAKTQASSSSSSSSSSCEAGKKQKKLPKEAFRYDAKEGAYHCPEGKRLEPVSRTAEKRPGGLELPVVVYRASAEDCGGCPRRECCTQGKRGRTVKRYEGEEAVERLRERMAQPESQEIYKQRCQSVELGYADLKEHRGLRVFRCFGLKRARAQAGLVILASNGLKLMRTLHQRNEEAPPHASPPETTAA